MAAIASADHPSCAHKPYGRTTWSVLRDYGTPVFVWGTWALMLLVALVFVKTYGVNVPYCDDFDYVVALTGEQPITVSWLWRPWAGPHRSPLPTLVILGLHRLSGDFRAAMYFSVLSIGALAFAMIWIAGRLRGRLSRSDAFFPLVLLHPGHCANFLWSVQITFILPVVLTCTLLLIIGGGEAQSRLRTAILAGVCLILLPLCNAAGMVLVPPLSLWLGYIGVRHWRSRLPQGRRDGALILGLTAAALLLVALYLRGLPSSHQGMDFTADVEWLPEWLQRTIVPKLWAMLQSSIAFLGLGFGPELGIPLEPLFTWKGALWIVSLGVAGLMLISAVALVRIIRDRPPDRPRALGLLLFLAAMTLLALALGYGRPGLISGTASRYVILAAPALCCIYFAWILHKEGILAKAIQYSLLVYCLVMLIPNIHYGITNGEYHKYFISNFERDLAAGVPNFILSSRYSPIIDVNSKLLHNTLTRLHQAGFGKFRLLREDPPFREVTVPVVPVATHHVTIDKAIVRATGAHPHLDFALPSDTFVGGVRLKYSHTYGKRAFIEPFKISWKGSGRGDFTESRSHLSTMMVPYMCEGPGEETAFVWVGDSLEQLRVELGMFNTDARPTFQISEITLLVPADEHFKKYEEGSDWPGESLRSPYGCSYSQGYSFPIRYRNTLGAFLRDIYYGIH